ncbi:HTH-type transcriptional regulator lrpC [Cedecea neteri]|uniref:HTH-type transcriptional regulator lrpC n=1 Tax=Cedecea neteri TaxID=158822 RepID=A0A2X2T3P0_9ENTR|nr:HTH-type transcriptional regulator lrpC [Cedecea neteri]
MNDYLPDDIDRHILTILAADARISLKVLSGKIGLSSPSTAERVKRLEERGVINGYTMNANLEALGYTLQGLVRMKPLPACCTKWRR